MHKGRLLRVVRDGLQFGVGGGRFYVIGEIINVDPKQYDQADALIRLGFCTEEDAHFYQDISWSSIPQTRPSVANPQTPPKDAKKSEPAEVITFAQTEHVDVYPAGDEEEPYRIIYPSKKRIPIPEKQRNKNR